MELKMEVYTPGLVLIGILEKYQSAIWEEKAFSAGSFSIEALLTDETRPLLREENIIWIEGETAGIIEHYDKTANTGTYITVKGRLLTGILERRILWGRYSMDASVPEIMRYLVNECAVNPTRGNTAARKIPGLFIVDSTAGGTPVRIQKTGGYMLDVLSDLGQTYHVSFGVRFNPSVPRMEFWTRWGADKSVHQKANDPVFYSTELDDVLSSEYSYDSVDWRNVALVAGEGEGDNRKMVTVEQEITENPETPDFPVPPSDMCAITLQVDPAGGGTASGGGSFEIGRRISVTALPAEGYDFSGWMENGSIASTERTYTFTVKKHRSLTAVFVLAKHIGFVPSGKTSTMILSDGKELFVRR